MDYHDSDYRRDYDNNRPSRARSGYDREERGAFDRAGDEVKSWFGDDEAERRRRRDERRDPDTMHYRDDRNDNDRSRYSRNRVRNLDDDRSNRGGMSRDYYGRDDSSSRDMMSRDYYGRDQDYRGSGDNDGGYGGSDYGSGGRERSMGSNQSSYAATVARGYDQDGSNWNRNPNTDGYESHFGKGPKNDQRSKERNQERVSDMLHDDHDLDASDIDVSTDDSGEVTLSGTVSSRMDKRRAEDCAYRVRSVRHVQNNITISDNDGDNISARSSGGSRTRKSASA